MGKIRQLSALEAQKIAAGEVVERPANVVKELIENALDAGASAITLYLENAGKSLIRCSDNGSGMSPEDARACILHHATSKIGSVDDLESLTTFGFRGEALSSIASVSHMKITTKETSELSGFCLELSQGTITNESITAANSGTDILIKDLFFNVPARKKFLKTKETEWRTIVNLFQALCLSYPEISYKLYHEDRLIYNYPAVQSITERLAQLFEQSFVKDILENHAVHETTDISCNVVFCPPTYTRFDRGQIFVFVNKRWVKNYKLTQAFIKGYAGMLPVSKYPAGCVFLTLDPSAVDVNIHPRKEEVHFTHPRIIEELITRTVQEKLETYHAEQLGAKPAPYVSPQTAPKQSYELFSFHEPFKPAHPLKQEIKNPSEELAFLEKIAPHFTQEKIQQPVSPQEQDFIKQSVSTHTAQETPFSTPVQMPIQERVVAPALNFRLIGQLMRTYILIETDKGLVLVDQHAAHERILYEKFRAHFTNPGRIRLVVPQLIVLTKEDALLLEPHLPLLSSFGIDAQLISDHELSIQETSLYTKNSSLEDCIRQLISSLYEHATLQEDELRKLIQERFHASMSCKAAVKAGDILSQESMQKLINDLSVTEERLTCPHGRPTLWELTKSEIEKKFKRDYRS